MGFGKYVLKNGMPAEEPDALAWEQWLEDARDERIVCQTRVSPDVLVSTVFLALDHNLGDGPPLLWETMIFGGPHHGFQDRYTTRAAAEAGHLDAIQIARGDKEPAA
jgi:hypothetical protein